MDDMGNVTSMKHAVRPLATFVDQLFIAAPMSGFSSEEEYFSHRNMTLSLVEKLKASHLVSSVYYAGTDVTTSSSYSGSNNAFHVDVSNLVKSDAMLFLYPNKVVSSALVEVGIAIGKCIPIVIVVNDRSDLPYMIQDVESYVDEGNIAPPIKIIECENPLEVVDEVVSFLSYAGCTC